MACSHCSAVWRLPQAHCWCIAQCCNAVPRARCSLINPFFFGALEKRPNQPLNRRQLRSNRCQLRTNRHRLPFKRGRLPFDRHWCLGSWLPPEYDWMSSVFFLSRDFLSQGLGLGGGALLGSTNAETTPARAPAAAAARKQQPDTTCEGKNG